jgi:hypothetical protein
MIKLLIKCVTGPKGCQQSNSVNFLLCLRRCWVVWLPLLLRIPEVPCSNFGSWLIIRTADIPSRKCGYLISNKAIVISLTFPLSYVDRPLYTKVITNFTYRISSCRRRLSSTEVLWMSLRSYAHFYREYLWLRCDFESQICSFIV